VLVENTLAALLVRILSWSAVTCKLFREENVVKEECLASWRFFWESWSGQLSPGILLLRGLSSEILCKCGVACMLCRMFPRLWDWVQVTGSIRIGVEPLHPNLINSCEASRNWSNVARRVGFLFSRIRKRFIHSVLIWTPGGRRTARLWLFRSKSTWF